MANGLHTNGGQANDPPLAPGLYLVATPIGNLEDITLRALRVLRTASKIACEDTRQTQKLLNHFLIATPSVSYHEHNEQSRSLQLLEELKNGAAIAVVSDAGTPTISDPGVHLAAAAIAEGVAVYPIPGANAAITALTGSGLNTERFLFHGFLPAKSGQRRSELEALTKTPEPTTHIYYEAPHRILETLEDISAALGSQQQVVLARELTKLHEEFHRGDAATLLADLKARPSIRGEFVLLLPVTPSEEPRATQQSIAAEVAALMSSENLSEMDALKRVAKSRGIGKSEAYRELQREQARRK